MAIFCIGTGATIMDCNIHGHMQTHTVAHNVIHMMNACEGIANHTAYMAIAIIESEAAGVGCMHFWSRSMPQEHALHNIA